MPWKKRKNGGVVQDRLTSMEVTEFYAAKRNLGAGMTARVVRAGQATVEARPLNGKEKDQPPPAAPPEVLA